MQNHYCLAYRDEGREMIPTIKVTLACLLSLFHELMSISALRSRMYSLVPLARGLLTRPLTEQTKRGDTDWLIHLCCRISLILPQVRENWLQSTRYYGDNESVSKVKFIRFEAQFSCMVPIRVEEITKEKDITMAQVAWCCSKSGMLTTFHPVASIKIYLKRLLHLSSKLSVLGTFKN